ncbi:hypothetical protein MBLNU230_g5521t1 [Neophaeotheca triangularis]
MPKPLTFKGDKKPKKRKRATSPSADDPSNSSSKSTALTTTSAAQAAPDDEDSWVPADQASDISGPVLFVLPHTTPPSCLASDALGAIFASPIENMVEGQPATAEPHDVRQVWIANKIVGGEGKFTFKGHQGRYLGCDRSGEVKAEREAAGSEETWGVVGVENDGSREGAVVRFRVRSWKEQDLTAVETEGGKLPEIRGQAGAGEGAEMLIRMQARFKPRLKADKAEKVRAKISRKELETEVGRKLEDEEVKKLKKARREGDFHEVMLDVKIKGKHDKFA